MSSKKTTTGKEDSKEEATEIDYVIEAILDIQGTGKNRQILVHWEGYPAEEATWEPYAYIKGRVPDMVKEYEAAHPASASASAFASAASSKRSKASSPKASASPAPANDGDDMDVEEKWEVESIVGERTRKGQRQLRVQWKGYPEAEATWEPYDTIREDAPLMVQEYETSSTTVNETEYVVSAILGERIMRQKGEKKRPALYLQVIYEGYETKPAYESYDWMYEQIPTMVEKYEAERTTEQEARESSMSKRDRNIVTQGIELSSKDYKIVGEELKKGTQEWIRYALVMKKRSRAQPVTLPYARLTPLPTMVRAYQTEREKLASSARGTVKKMAKMDEVEKIVGRVKRDGELFFLVKWKGYEQITEEPYYKKLEEVPELVREYLKEHHPDEPMPDSAASSAAASAAATLPSLHTHPLPFYGDSGYDLVEATELPDPHVPLTDKEITLLSLADNVHDFYKTGSIAIRTYMERFIQRYLGMKNVTDKDAVEKALQTHILYTKAEQKAKKQTGIDWNTVEDDTTAYFQQAYPTPLGGLHRHIPLQALMAMSEEERDTLYLTHDSLTIDLKEVSASSSSSSSSSASATAVNTMDVEEDDEGEANEEQQERVAEVARTYKKEIQQFVREFLTANDPTDHRLFEFSHDATYGRIITSAFEDTPDEDPIHYHCYTPQNVFDSANTSKAQEASRVTLFVFPETHRAYKEDNPPESYFVSRRAEFSKGHYQPCFRQQGFSRVYPRQFIYRLFPYHDPATLPYTTRLRNEQRQGPSKGYLRDLTLEAMNPATPSDQAWTLLSTRVPSRPTILPLFQEALLSEGDPYVLGFLTKMVDGLRKYDHTLLLDIKRCGDQDQVDAARIRATTSPNRVVMVTGDRLCALLARMVGLDAILDYTGQRTITLFRSTITPRALGTPAPTPIPYTADKKKLAVVETVFPALEKWVETYTEEQIHGLYEHVRDAFFHVFAEEDRKSGYASGLLRERAFWKRVDAMIRLKKGIQYVSNTFQGPKRETFRQWLSSVRQIRESKNTVAPKEDVQHLNRLYEWILSHPNQVAFLRNMEELETESLPTPRAAIVLRTHETFRYDLASFLPSLSKVTEDHPYFSGLSTASPSVKKVKGDVENFLAMFRMTLSPSEQLFMAYNERLTAFDDTFVSKIGTTDVTLIGEVRKTMPFSTLDTSIAAAEQQLRVALSGNASDETKQQRMVEAVHTVLNQRKEALKAHRTFKRGVLPPLLQDLPFVDQVYLPPEPFTKKRAASAMNVTPTVDATLAASPMTLSTTPPPNANTPASKRSRAQKGRTPSPSPSPSAMISTAPLNLSPLRVQRSSSSSASLPPASAPTPLVRSTSSAFASLFSAAPVAPVAPVVPVVHVAPASSAASTDSKMTNTSNESEMIVENSQRGGALSLSEREAKNIWLELGYESLSYLLRTLHASKDPRVQLYLFRAQWEDGRRTYHQHPKDVSLHRSGLYALQHAYQSLSSTYQPIYAELYSNIATHLRHQTPSLEALYDQMTHRPPPSFLLPMEDLTRALHAYKEPPTLFYRWIEEWAACSMEGIDVDASQTFTEYLMGVDPRTEEGRQFILGTAIHTLTEKRLTHHPLYAVLSASSAPASPAPAMPVASQKKQDEPRRRGTTPLSRPRMTSQTLRTTGGRNHKTRKHRKHRTHSKNMRTRRHKKQTK